MVDELSASSQRDQRINEIISDYLEAVDAGQAPDRQEWLRWHPEFAAELEAFLADYEHVDRMAEPLRPAAAPAPSERAVPGDVATMDSAKPPAVGTGTTIRYFGDYELLEEIGRGGMGVVYKARQVSLNRVVALKMILAGQLATESDVRRFHTEAEAAAQLDHPGIVPIYEVGQHAGRHYFSMAFVEGQSLARRLTEALPAPREAAELTRQVALAIAYAHVEGVIHRDLKPSNILLQKDEGGRMKDEMSPSSSSFIPHPSSFLPRVTDFGLAKRVEADSSLTATGQILGTPSYMSPEQARGKTDEIGPAADIYSLGAVLYCLLTGRPPFQAASPLDTLKQVTDQVPVTPRRLNSTVPRDLQTICLKCLEKEPRRRYASARELADDLQRFLQDVPIRARRVGPAERVRRWLWKRRRAVAISVAGLAAGMLLVVGGIIGWNRYQQSRLGRIMLTTKGPPLTAEVLDRQDKLVVPRFTVPTLEPVAIRAGSYQLRLSSPGRLNTTMQILVERGTDLTFPVELDNEQLWEPIGINREEHCEMVEFDGRADLVVVSRDGLRRLDGVSGELVWEFRINQFRDNPALAKLGNSSWSNWAQPGSDHARARLLSPAPDLDGDGYGDLVFTAGKHSCSMVAVSGRVPRALWSWSLPAHHPGYFGPPISAHVDSDGRPDLIVAGGTAWVSESEGGRGWEIARRWSIEAVSGATGETLWRFAPALRLLLAPKIISHGGKQTGAAVSEQQITPGPGVPLSGKQVVAAVFEQRSVGLELQTGKPVWEQEVDLRDGYGVRGQFADVDGDGHDDALLFGEQLTALALRTGKLLWRSPLKGADLKYETSLPLTADLVSGGAKGVVVPIGGFGPGGWRGVKVLDGATGQPRWQRELEPSGRPNFSGWGGDWGREGPHNHFIAGPDIDADDQQEVFVVTLAGEGPQSGRFNLCVDALSGQDGHLVWSSQHPIVSRITNSVAGLGQLRWWQVGADGWPLLVVPFQNKSGSHEREDVAFFFLAGTGRIAHRVEGCHEPEMPDLTGDGLPDLCWLESLVAGGKKLHALRGAPPAVWRRRELWKPAADFDADGITDLVSSGSFDIGGVAWNGRSAGKSSPRGDPAAAQITLGGAVGGAPILPKVAAVSGRDGTILWRSEKQWQCSGVPPLRHADLDGDGIADLLGVWEGGAGTAGYRTAISALSGKTGQVLWTVERTADASRAIQASTFRFMTTCDLEGDGRTEVLFGHLGSGVPTFSLEVLFGRDGAPRWTQSWQWKQIAKQWVLLYRLEALANLDGDATLDLVLRTTTGEFQGPVSEAELLAFSGADGKLLWRRKGQTLQSQIGDLDGDGLAEVIVIEDALIALDGKTGQTKWTWQWSDPGKPSSGGGSVRPLCGPVLANLDGGDRRCVCLLLPDETVILDAHGKVRCRTALPEAARSQRGFVPSEVPVQLWPYDVDADGRDELLFLLAYPADGPDPLRFAQTLRVTADGAERVLWEWALPHGFGQVLEILPPAGGRPATIVVQAGDDVYGLAGPTGIPVWRCDGLSRWIQDPRLWQSYLVLPPTLLPASDPQGFPRILFYPADRWQFEGTDCRLALPTSPDGKYLPPDEAAVAYRRPADDGKPIKPAEPQERGDRELTILKNLARQCPEVSAFGRQLARHHVERCCALAQAGRPDEARAEFQKAESAWHLQAKRFQAKEKGYRDALKASPDNPDANHDLAWFLATCPDPHFRDPHKAVELAKRAMELSSPGTWHRVRDVGVAQYRAGDWQAAIVALERAAPGGWDAFYLAMSYQQLGDKEKARQWYDKALSYAKSQTAEREYEELMYLRAEAAVLMATGQAPASGKPVKKE